MHQTKKVMPAIGTTTAFTVNRWRLQRRSALCPTVTQEDASLHLVNGEPDRGKRDEPEEEEAHEVLGVGARRGRHVVGF